MRKLRSEERWELTHLMEDIKRLSAENECIKPQVTKKAGELLIEILRETLDGDFYNRFAFIEAKTE